MNSQNLPLREICARGLVGLAYSLKDLNDSVVDSVIRSYLALRKKGLESGLPLDEVKMYDDFLVKILSERGGK